MADFLKDITLAKNRKLPLYLQLYRQIKEYILGGRLTPGQRLPPIRTMAASLAINTITVVRAFELLGQEGLVQKHVGRGTFVSIPAHNEDLAEGGGRSRHETDGSQYDFSTLSPSPELFPVEDIKVFINRVLDLDKGHAFSYQASQGYLPLREQIRHMLAAEGIKAGLDNIQIISGAQQGIDIAAKVLIDHGDTLFVENPTYPGSLATFRSRGAQIIGIPLTPNGLDLERLADFLEDFRPRLFYVMTSFQNPTGYSHSRQEKDFLLKMAYRYNFYILEDDYLSELDYASRLNRKSPLSPPLKALDRWDRVILLKSFSKILMPGLRIGFLVLPDQLKARMIAAKHAADISTSGLLQRTLHLFLESGKWKEHLNRVREEYFARYKVLSSFLQADKNLKYLDPLGGMFFWVRLPENHDSDRLFALARRQGLLIAPGSAFSVDGRPSPYFRLSYAALPPAQIKEGTALLAGIINNLLTEKIPPPTGEEPEPLI